MREIRIKIEEYDENGRLALFRDSDGTEYTWDYDEYGRVIHFKSSTGFEKWWKYNELTTRIRTRYENGKELLDVFDKRGNLICQRNANGKVYVNNSIYGLGKKEDYGYFDNLLRRLGITEILNKIEKEMLHK